MRTPGARTFTGWAIAVHRRGKNRGAGIRGFVGQRFVWPTREEARVEARKVRVLGLCATPVRVRILMEAREG